MYCPSCGKQFSDEYEICPFCGKVVKNQAPKAQPNPRPATNQVPPQQQYAQPQQQYNQQNQQYAQPQQYAPAQQQYNQQNQQNQYNNMPPQRPQLECNRSWIKVLLLSIVTCGIYGIITYYRIAEDLNTICTPHDNKKTQNYIVACLLGGITCGIYTIVWMHGMCDRIGENLRARGIAMEFSSSTFWLWNVLGSFIVVGPFIFMYKFFDAMNALAADYNARG